MRQFEFCRLVAVLTMSFEVGDSGIQAQILNIDGPFALLTFDVEVVD